MNKEAIIIDIEDKISYLKKFNNLIPKQLTKPTSIEEIKEKVLTEQVDKIFYLTEYQYLFSEIMFSIQLLKSFTKIESSIINDFYEENSNKVYKRRFYIENDKILESEKGFLENQRKQVDTESFQKLVKFFEENTSPN